MDEIVGAANRRAQWRRERRNALTKQKRQRFLEELAATSNVRHAAWAAMAHPSSFYDLRRRDPAFRQAWQQALDEAYESLETELLARARGTADGADGTVDLKAVEQLMKQRNMRPAGGGGRGRTVKHVPIEDVEKAVLQQILQLSKRLGGGVAAAALPAPDRTAAGAAIEDGR